MIQLQVTINPQTTNEEDSKNCREIAEAIVERTRLGEPRHYRGINKVILGANERLIENLSEDLRRGTPKSLLSALEIVSKGIIRSKLEREFLRLIRLFESFRKYKCPPVQRTACQIFIRTNRISDEGIFSATHKKMIPTDDGKSDDLLRNLLQLTFCPLILRTILCQEKYPFQLNLKSSKLLFAN